MPHVVSIVVLALSLAPQPGVATKTVPNTLTPAEQAAGWQLLFDGRSLDAWRGYRRDTLPEAGWRTLEPLLAHDGLSKQVLLNDNNYIAMTVPLTRPRVPPTSCM